MSFKKTYEKFDKEFCKTLEQYHKLHEELDKFRGIELTPEIVEQANPIIMAIQDKYIELDSAIEWAIQRYQLCARLRLQYEEFIDHIKKGGGIIAETKDEAQA